MTSCRPKVYMTQQGALVASDLNMPEVEVHGVSKSPRAATAAAAAQPEPTVGSLDASASTYLQQELAKVLEGIAQIKQNCHRLETENRFIREYIASLMGRAG